MRFDALVIGGGIAGCVAAIRAARTGAATALCYDKPGASVLSSGIFDIDSNPGRVKSLHIPDNASFGDNLHLLKTANPCHPYSIMGGRVSEVLFRKAVGFFRDAVNRGGLELGGSADQRLLLANNLGTMKRSRLALKSIADGDLKRPGSMRVVFLGFSGVAEFDPQFVSKSLNDLIENVAGSRFDAVADFYITIPGTEGFSNISPFHAAALLDRMDCLEIVIKEIKEKIIRGGFTHAAFPAALGLRNNREVIRRMEEALSIKVFEIATVQPSVPGKRIMDCLMERLEAEGVTLLSGKAVPHSISQGRIESMSVSSGRDSNTIVEAANIVLASGKFIGGGVRLEDKFTEEIFDLPVFYKDNPATGRIALEPAVRLIADKQPLFSCGVKIDNELRPVGLDGEPVYGNLYCAGSVIGGYDSVRDGCGAGVAIITGYAAGLKAAEKK